MIIEHPPPLELLKYAAQVGSSYRNAIRSVEPRVGRPAMIVARDLLHSTISGALASLENREVLATPSALYDTFSVVHNQLRFLDYLLVTGLDDPLSESELIEATEAFLQVYVIGDYDDRAARERLIEFEESVSRKDALLIRTRATGQLVRSAANLLGVPWADLARGEIRRSITFPPEMKQAAIGVLSYFSEILDSKYPEHDVGVTIEQSDDKVVLLVTTPEGAEERIEQELDDYGLVVTGNLTPEEYLANPVQAMALRQKLEIAALELRQTKQLLAGERQQYGNRIDGLQEEVAFLRRLLDRDQYTTTAMTEALAVVANEVSPIAKDALLTLRSMVEQGTALKDHQLAVAQLKLAVQDDRSVVDRLNELIVKGAVQGTAGNYLFSWLQGVAAMF